MTHHYLGSYQQALLAVCLTQFSSKRYTTGMRGVLQLAQVAAPFAHLFERSLGLTIEDMERLSRYILYSTQYAVHTVASGALPSRPSA